MDNILLVGLLVILLVLVAYIFRTVERIKNARAIGKKMHKRNIYYAVITKLFIKDLPD